MEVVIVDSTAAIGSLVADTIETLIRSKPEVSIGLATGSSPLPVYRELVRRHREEGLSFQGVTAYMLDEYLGLPAGHPQQYRSFLHQEFVDHIDLQPGRLLGPDVGSERPDVAGAAYDELIGHNGGIDLQILGIGADGHIGFNEPSSSLASRTRPKTLTEETRRDNARFFNGDLDAVPRHVVTQGIGTILDARHIVLVASGFGKAPSLARAIEGPVTAMTPASALQFHPHVSVVIDERAASELSLASYFRHTYKHKPDWQGL